MDIFFFQNGGRPPSWIFLQVKNDVTARCGLSICTTLPNLVTMAQKAAELLRFSFFKMAAAAILDSVGLYFHTTHEVYLMTGSYV